MKQLFRSRFCLLLVLVMLLSTACGKPQDSAGGTEPSSAPTSPTTEPTTPSEPTPPATFDTPILRFAVTSDVHIREASANMESYARLESFYKTVYAYSDAQTDYNKLDSIVFIGDITNGGTAAQYTYFFDYLKAHTRPDTVARAVLGNHEFYATGHYTDASMAQAPLRFLEYSGYESIDSHQVIGSYHFIFLGMDLYEKKTNTYFSSAKQQWLIKELNAAVADDPTKPIFVFQHEPPKSTVLGSHGQNGDAGLKIILSKYPQVVDFSGHSHRPINNPRSVWQDTFTALNTGSLAYLSCPIPDHASYSNGGIVATDNEGGWRSTETEEGLRNGGMYYIVEVDKNHIVRVLIYDMFTESLWGEPIIIDSLDPKNFKYTDDRKKVSDKPVYAENAALALLSSTGNTAEISIPQATSKDVVQSYRMEVYQGDTLVDTVYRLACTFYGDAAPTTIKAPLHNLQPATTYNIKVYAVNSWAKESDPLVLNFSTTAS